jgi:hypothetical protein
VDVGALGGCFYDVPRLKSSTSLSLLYAFREYTIVCDNVWMLDDLAQPGDVMTSPPKAIDAVDATTPVPSVRPHIIGI